MTAHEPISEKTLAGAALSAGLYALGRSFRFHRARGAFCHDGWCQQCKVRLSDGRNVLACRTPASDLALIVKPRSGLRLLGKLAEFLQPWFHEKTMIRPRFLRQAYFHLLRNLSGALPLPGLLEPPCPKKHMERTCQYLVIGGGVAGMAAAIELARDVRDVLLVDNNPLDRSARNGPLAALVLSLRAEVKKATLTILESTTCIGLYDDAKRATLVGPNEMSVVAFDELIVATGAYDRLPAFEGNDRPGIIGLRAFEKLLQNGDLPGHLRIGLFVAPDHEDRAIAALSAFNRTPAWIASPGMLQSSGHGSFSRTRLKRAYGLRRLRGVIFESGQRLSCDVLVLGFSQPSYELQIQAGQSITFDRDSGTMLITGKSRVPLLVVGEAAGATTIEAAAAHATEAVKAKLRGQAVPARKLASCPPLAIKSGEAFICACEDVRVKDIERAMDDGYVDIEHLKRRTGAGTGPCQGKLCHAELAHSLSERGVKVNLPTIRPLLRPTALAEFFVEGSDAGEPRNSSAR